jgi:2-succinyl-6-hydroxy-2,4-cyclohexadiene-1-carboxylate synthase
VTVAGRTCGNNTGVSPTARDPEPAATNETEPAATNDTARLATIVAGEGPRVVLIHGFTQTSRCWGPFADSLAADGWQLVAVDAPGHGRSSGIQAAVPRAAELAGAAGGRAVYIGYSMGARFALRLALDRPDLVRAVVLIGVSPGIEDAAARTARIAEDEARATYLEAVGVEQFVDEWLTQPLFSSLPADQAHRDERIRNTVTGLASSLRLAGTGAMAPMWDQLDRITVPALLVTGERDEKFTAIARRMVPLMEPHAWAVEVPGAGHSVHLEQPAPTATFVTSWLRAVADRP